MHDVNHWYLVVISVPEEKVYIVDCSVDSKKNEMRQRKATSSMMKFISKLFKLVYANSGSAKSFSSISDFELSFLEHDVNHWYLVVISIPEEKCTLWIVRLIRRKMRCDNVKQHLPWLGNYPKFILLIFLYYMRGMDCGSPLP
ncbi:hypothetical protein LINGRAHAP2_LOCUS30051 [Linum grandiflorum]